MKISVISHDLSHNALGRAYILTKVLKRQYDVELIGPINESGIWKPLSAEKIEYKSVPNRLYPGFISSIKDMMKLISGNVIYAIKTQPASFGVSILKKLSSKIPIVLDIDDWETGFAYENSRNSFTLIANSILHINHPDNFFYTRLIEKLTSFANDITVISNFFKNKFGGTIVPHGRDTIFFDPDKYDKNTIRKKKNLLYKKIILFLGTIHHYKGIDTLISAIKMLNDKDTCLMIIGDSKIDISGINVIVIDTVPFSHLPELLTIGDLVVIPQKRTKATIGQIPAKLFDAMAMAKPIISTNVSDIPDILENCGWIVEPDNAESLAEKIDYVFQNKSLADEMGKKARKKCIENYSYDAMEKLLMPIFDKYK
jgi:glycosyltransferase involved in cell wall biosynthesis